MKIINVIFDEDYDDVDLIFVPNFVADKIDQYAQEFCDWLSNPHLNHKCYAFENGRKYINCETVGFIDWLNNSVILNNCEKAELIGQHLLYDARYPSVEF